MKIALALVIGFVALALQTPVEAARVDCRLAQVTVPVITWNGRPMTTYVDPAVCAAVNGPLGMVPVDVEVGDDICLRRDGQPPCFTNPLP